MAEILAQLALAYIAGRLNPASPGGLVALVAELGRVLKPEDIAEAWKVITRVALKIKAYQQEHGFDAEHAAQVWIDAEGTAHAASDMLFHVRTPEEAAADVTGGEG